MSRLKKSLYGLKQAPKAWYLKLKATLQNWGFVRAISNVSLFIKKTADYVMFVLVYVDDILIIGSNSTTLKSCICDLDTHFALKTLGLVNYFIGFEAFRDNSYIYLTQTKYVGDLLEKAAMADFNPCETPMAAGNSLTDEGESFSNPSLYRTHPYWLIAILNIYSP